MQDGLNQHFLLRKLHSLTGLVPAGVFLMFHMWENSLSRRNHLEKFGPGNYYNDHVVKFINDINYIRLLEVALLGSILFHAVYGAVIWWQGKNNVTQYKYVQNWGYFLQRITALATFAFIAYHVTTTRFAGDAVTGDLFGHMAATLQNPGVMVIYMLGVLLASFHLAYGIWLMAITWGLATHPRAQKLMMAVGAGLFAVLVFMGFHGLWGFNQAFFA
jgi:succinate dehydrogenase / fumarate reductase, cytochrome b subunit